jgi:hypothetical protein
VIPDQADAPSMLSQFDSLCECLYGSGQYFPASQGAPTKDRNIIATNKSQANLALNVFTENPQNLEKLRFVLENSNSVYSQYLAASSLKQLFTTHWSKIPSQEKVGIKDYLLNFLVNKGVNSDQQVLKMVIILLAKVVKMSWFDHPEL